LLHRVFWIRRDAHLEICTDGIQLLFGHLSLDDGSTEQPD